MKYWALLICSILLLSTVFAATYYTKDPATCPATDAVNFPGQNCAPTNICGDIGSIAQCQDTSGFAIPAVYNAGYQTQVSSALATGYIFNCYATTTCVDKWSCDTNSTCNTWHRPTRCESTTVAPCDLTTCSSGYYDCDGDPNTCEIANGAACTTAYGTPGTRSGCTCVGTKSNFITGTYTQYGNDADENFLWGKNYSEFGDLINLFNLDNSSFIVDKNGKTYATDFCLTGTATCLSTVTGGSGTDTNWVTSWPIFDANMKATYALIGSDTNIWTGGVLDTDTNAVLIDWNMNGNSIFNVYDVNASHNFNVSNQVNTAFLCDNFGVACIDMTGDPWWFSGNWRFGSNVTVDENIYPFDTLYSDIGSGAKRWLNLFVSHINTDDLTATGDINTSGRFCLADGNCFNSMADINGSGGGTGSGTDTNWQTSWDVFDVNMKATYSLLGSVLDTNWETSWDVFDANMSATYLKLLDFNSYWDNRFATQYSPITDYLRYLGGSIFDVNTSDFSGKFLRDDGNWATVTGSGLDTNTQTAGWTNAEGDWLQDINLNSNGLVGVASVDNVSGVRVWDTGSFMLKDSSALASINHNQRTLLTDEGWGSVNWANKTLSDGEYSTSLDWSSKILYGDWNTGSSGQYRVCDSSGNCPSGSGTDTNAWTAGIISDQNVFQIDLNTTGKLVSLDGNLCDGTTCYKISDLNISGGSPGASDWNSTMALGNVSSYDVNVFKTNALIKATNTGGNSKTISMLADNATDASYIKATTGVPASSPTAVSITSDTLQTSANPADINFAKTTPFSVEFWLEWETTSPYASNNLLYKSASGKTTKGWNFYLVSNNGNPQGTFNFELADGTNNRVFSFASNPNVAGTYKKHVVITHDGNGVVVTYVDGSTVGNSPSGATFASIGDMTNTSSLTLKGIWGATNVDELVIWDKVLSAGEVTTRYNAGAGLYTATGTANAVSIWHFDNLLTDSQSSNNFSVTSGSVSYVAGTVTAPPGDSEVQVLKVTDGVSAGANGTIELGNTTADTVLNGGTINRQYAGVNKVTGTSTGETFIDNYKHWFGTGNDMAAYYDGTHQYFSQEVGTGQFKFLGGDVNISLKKLIVDNNSNLTTINNTNLYNTNTYSNFLKSNTDINALTGSLWGAYLRPRAGSGTANTAPLKFTSGGLNSASEAGAVEFETDDYYATITTGAGSAFANALPPGYNSTYVKSTSQYLTYAPYNPFDVGTSVTGAGSASNLWISGSGGWTNQNLQVDLNTAKIVTRVYYENYHTSGGTTNRGIKDYQLYGSNDANFLVTTWGVDTNWNLLTVDDSQFDRHVDADVADPKYINVTNTTAYRYYRFKISTSYDTVSQQFMGVRRIALQTSVPNGRKNIVLTDNGKLTSGRIPYATTNGRLADSNNLLFDGNSITINGRSSGLSLWTDGNISATGYITRTDVYDSTKNGNALNSIKDFNNYLTLDAKSNQVIDHKAFGYSFVEYDRTVFDKLVEKKTITLVKDGENIFYWDLSGKEISKEVADKDYTKYFDLEGKEIKLEDLNNFKSDEYTIKLEYTITTETKYKEVETITYEPTYKTIKEEGIDLVKEVSLIKQAVYEIKKMVLDLINTVTGLQTKVTALETENNKIKDCAKNSIDYKTYQTCITK